jgi:prepilin-type N-terminal cleavage/methylation domain-containing protein
MRQEITCFSAKDFASKEESIMKAKLKKILRREGGFTLTELAVAMLVVGILSAIAVPSFLGARNTAFDKAAQASVDAALVAATVHYAQFGDFTDSATATCSGSTVIDDDLQKLDPNVIFQTGSAASDSEREISVNAMETWNASGESLGCQAFYAAALSRSGTCWVARITVEGKYLLVSQAGPIVVSADASTENSEQDTFTDLAVNGNAYAGIKTDGAGASITSTDELEATADACNAADQSTGVAAGSPGVIGSGNFYDSWRTVVLGTPAALAP